MNFRSFGASPVAPNGADAGKAGTPCGGLRGREARPPRSKCRGFSLIEVALALAVAGFTLSGLAALLVVVFNSSKSSTDDTLVAGMAGAIISDLRRQYFVDKSLIPPANTNPKRPSGAASVLPGTNDVATGTQPVAATSVVYFDASGLQLTGSSNAIYRCTETFQGDPITLGATGSDGSTAFQQINLLHVMLTFQWPVQATTPNSKIIHASIARY